MPSWRSSSVAHHPDVPDNYRSYSPFAWDGSIDSRLKDLKEVAVRAYTEPDIEWWMAHRNKDYYGMNAVDAAALINQLQLIGNKEAELVTTLDQGYRLDGSRHPHTWAIVDNQKLVSWFVNLP